jgi:hypothetical protein
LAGGLNLYGFAAGDPVTFSDPFGLCPPQDEDVQNCPTVLYWRQLAARSTGLKGFGFTLMAGLAAIGEDIGATARGYPVGGCGTKYVCGVLPAISPQSGVSELGLDATGKLHGRITGRMSSLLKELGELSSGRLEELGSDIESSLRVRRAEALRLGEDALHRLRIGEEETLLRRIMKLLSGS